MELRQLRAFVAVATEGHFGRAAARLNLTQPGLTLRIQALERELGAQLLARNAREVQLTPAGKVLLPHARSLIRVEDRALRELKDQADAVAGRLRLSYLSHGAVAFPGRLVAELRRRHPVAQIETTYGHSALNIELLLEGAIDAAFVHPAFVGLAGAMVDGIAVRLLSRDAVMLALPANHPLGRLEPIPVKALRGEPLVAFPSTAFQGFPAKLERWLARHTGAEPNVVMREPPDQALEAVARSTSLISFANSSRIASTPVPGVVYRRMTPELVIDFGIAYWRDDESPMLANLLSLVDEMAPDEPGALPKGSELLTSEEPQATSQGHGRHTSSRPAAPLGLWGNGSRAG
jgi:DNA-binding transcriptional LysR family regulator